MKVNKKTLMLTSLICLLPIVPGLLLYDRLPDQLPSHWNFRGEIDGWMPKTQAIFLLPVIMAVTNLLVFFFVSNDPKKRNIEGKIVLVTLWLIPLLSVVTQAVVYAVGMGVNIDVGSWVNVVLGIVFIFIGNYLPKSRQNYTVGIRLPWTLNSEENWNRTHRLGGILWVIGGFGVILTNPRISLGSRRILLLATLIPTVYSFLLYKKGV